jgi:crossover junction endodeoxyribonuclease RuvC
MIVIGIDPGTATTGFGIVKKVGDSFSCLDYGVITTDKEKTPASRLFTLNKKLSLIIKKYSPDFLAIESVYFFKNLKTVLPVSQAKGVIMFTAEKAKLPIYEFTPLEVKMTITGYGRADKKQVQEMVKLSLNLEKIPRPDDAADALGIAICGILKKNSPF